MISFEHDDSLTDIEDSYKFISPDVGNVLRIPSALEFGGMFAVQASYIQFVATWARAIRSCTLRAYGTNVGADSLYALAQEPHGLCAIYFAQEHVDGKNHGISKPRALNLAAHRIAAMQALDFRGTMAGRGAFLCCFAGAKNEFLLPLYSKSVRGSVRGRSDFEKLTMRMIISCAPSLKKLLRSDQLSSISSLIFELFKNTDDHATTDEQFRPYTWDHPNVRGIMMKFVSTTDSSQVARMTHGDAPLQSFLTRSILNKPKRATTTGIPQAAPSTNFLEITVFDTGPGLARRWWAAHSPNIEFEKLSIEQEEALVRECFALHATTKNTDGSGVGLDSVIAALSELKAYLRLRTGRVCLYQDFAADQSLRFAPKRWLRSRPELPSTSGASYSILVPVVGGPS